jgi:hypothetical protein
MPKVENPNNKSLESLLAELNIMKWFHSQNRNS